MTYRTSSPPPLYVEPTRDPFPQVACYDCGARTTSMNGEDLCAACDLKWLKRGVDWAIVQHGWRHNYPKDACAPSWALVTREIRCGYCGTMKPWPRGFPSSIHAECHECARARVRLEERRFVAIVIARVGQFIHDVITASRGI